MASIVALALTGLPIVFGDGLSGLRVRLAPPMPSMKTAPRESSEGRFAW
jgi:hypothetical protein